MKDWPRIAKLQSDLLAQALVTRQTRVASYMLTEGPRAFPVPMARATPRRGTTTTPTPMAVRRERTAPKVSAYCVTSAAGTWKSSHTCWRKLHSIPEGDGTVLDHTCLLYVHEHAEANPHKNSGLAMIVAGHAGRLATGMHSKVTGTVGDLYVTVADDVLNAGIGKFPTATRKISEILA